jgi:hypothetical protein
MAMYSLAPQKGAVSRSTFLRAAAMFSGAIVAIGCAGPASAGFLSANPLLVSGPLSDHTILAQAPGEDTLARCQQLFGLWSRHNTDGYAKPLDARMGLEDCQKGNITAGITTLKRALERAQIPIPPANAVAQTPETAPPTLKPRGEKRRTAQ